ncbi:MAG: Lactate utilization protein C [Calditrichaeota bacterium]|nr:Lactate utilization protein C [Calditrichota bacterium]
MNTLDRFARLRAALADVDAHLVVIGAGRDATAAIVNLLAEEGARRVALTNEPLLYELALPDALYDAKLERIDPPAMNASWDDINAWREALARADAGLTSAFGIAEETGSMLLPPLAPDQRAVSLLPLHHIAVLRAGQIAPDVGRLVERWADGGDTDGSAVFVTGPSRTADIEKELVLGAHGPQRVTVVVLDD